MLDIVNHSQTDAGVGPTLHVALDPRQQRFIELYLGVESKTFGNCYRSALLAGYSDQTARNLTHNKPKWYSEIIGHNEGLQPEHLVLKLAEVINDDKESTQNKLKAVDMMMRHKGMYQSKTSLLTLNSITIESILD